MQPVTLMTCGCN